MSERGKAPSREQIELRAYQIYVERGRVDGHDLADWLAAEEQLTSQSQSAVPESATSDSPRTAVLKIQRSSAA
jgi:Protein of unknown function (DUF2934)